MQVLCGEMVSKLGVEPHLRCMASKDVCMFLTKRIDHIPNQICSRSCNRVPKQVNKSYRIERESKVMAST